MKTIGYLRVSTSQQDLENQKTSVSKYSDNMEYLTETVSGKVSWKDRELGKLVNTLENGDILVVSELSRLGRSFYEVMELLSELSPEYRRSDAGCG